MEVQKFWNDEHTHYAALYSPGWGAGWSSYTWNDCPELAYDRRVVAEILPAIAGNNKAYLHTLTIYNSPSQNAFKQKLLDWGYPDHIYFGGLDQIAVEWIPEGVGWRVEEYDGNEHIVYDYDDRSRWIY